MTAISTLLAFLVAHAPVAHGAAGDPAIEGERSPWADCHAPGVTLSLTSSGVPLRHEGPAPITRAVMRSSDGREHAHEWKGLVGCLAFSKARNAFVLGMVGERGAWLVLGGVLYFDAGTGEVSLSAAWQRRDDTPPWSGFAAVPSEDGRFVAFIADDDSRPVLDVLDTVLDRHFPLGRPPLPPPSVWAAENVEHRSSFNWGDAQAGADGFIALDQGIVVWVGHTLEVSYGKDGPRRRARARTKRIWDMEVTASSGPGRGKRP